MARLRPSVAAALAVVALVQTSHAATIRVPEHQPTIQAGINAAATHDTVLVRCGTYLEDDITMRPGIVLRSLSGAPSCVLVRSQHPGYVILCDAGGPDTRIEGLTLQGGSSGLICTSASPTVSNCAFSDHDGSSILPSHGVQLDESSATFTSCIFEGNQIALGATDCPTVILANCVFFNNPSDSYGVLSLSSVSTTLMTNCLFAGNSGPCVSAQDCGSLAAGGCTFTGSLELNNTAATVSNSILAFNPVGESVVCTGTAFAELLCCDVFGNRSGDWVGCIADQGGQNGNFSADPRFCLPPFDYSISSASPCAAANAPPGCGLIGATPVGCVAQAVAPSTWGRVKAMYR